MLLTVNTCLKLTCVPTELQKFAKGNRWGYFPSFSAGWNFSREKFMEFATSVLSSGKLRASWGELGNQNIPGNYYPYLSPIITEESYPIGASNTPVMGLWQKQNR